MNININIKIKPHEVIFVLVLKGIFGGSLKITSEIKIKFKAKRTSIASNNS